MEKHTNGIGWLNITISDLTVYSDFSEYMYRVVILSVVSSLLVKHMLFI